jgi:hypothetical protein
LEGWTVDLNRLLNPQGLNWWTVVSGMGLNFVLTSFLLLGAASVAAQGGSQVVSTLMVAGGAFLIPLLTAYVCGRMMGERFLAYGMYPLAGFLVVAVAGVLSTGVFGLLFIGFGLLGAFNGATLAARRAMRRRHTIEKEE